jgi:hypothetical protein
MDLALSLQVLPSLDGGHTLRGFLNLIAEILVSLWGYTLIGSRSLYSSGIDAFELAGTGVPRWVQPKLCTLSRVWYK